MNEHIPDVTKMISDTPRMKAAQMAAIEHGTGDVWRVGCDIERELNAANDRIKLLEEALEATAKVIGPPGKSTWVSDDELNHAWELYTKSKEAKL